MDIYHVVRVIPVGYNSIGEMVECVVIATDEDHARRLAAQDHQREQPDVWFTKSVTVHLLGPSTDNSWARMVCNDITLGMT